MADPIELPLKLYSTVVVYDHKYSKTPLNAGYMFQYVPALNETVLNEATRIDAFVL